MTMISTHTTRKMLNHTAVRDYELMCQRSLDKDTAIAEMEDYIDTHHVYSFRRFAQYCRANQPTWHRHLTTDCGWYVKEYIKSAYWDDLTPEGQAVANLRIKINLINY